MKAIITAAMVAMASPPVTAQTVETCSQLGDLAESTMAARQRGVRPSDVLEVFRASGISKAGDFLVTEAYARPRYSTREFRLGTVIDFRNRIEAACLAGR